MIEFTFSRPEVTGPFGTVTGAHDVAGNLIEYFEVVTPGERTVIARCNSRLEADRVAQAVEDLFASAVEVEDVRPLQKWHARR